MVMSYPVKAFTRLINKRLVLVNGRDSPKFLNGIITRRLNVDNYDSYGFYCGFLNSKGRILSDSFVYPIHNSSLLDDNNNTDPGYIVECDEGIVDKLLGLLKLYRLTAKVNIELLDWQQYSSWQVWDDSHYQEEHKQDLALDITNSNILKPYLPDLVGANDTRCPGLGLRLVLANTKSPLDVLSDVFTKSNNGFILTDSDAYKIKRYLNGIPEGVSELIPEKALPLESNMDFMGGIDFNKGCYVGQELTIRSYHHGIIRKRIIPVILSNTKLGETEFEYDSSVDYTSLIGSSIFDISSNSILASETQTSNNNKKLTLSGKLLGSIGNLGLALVRLEHFQSMDSKFVITDEQNQQNVYVEGYEPYWWPQME